MINQEAVDLWLEALESGEYSQTRAVLHDDVGYCCLGVACDVYQKHVGGLTITKTTEGPILYNNRKGALPEVVQAWLGMKTRDGKFDFDLADSLANANDRGVSFTEIANIIRNNKEKLFA